MKTRPNVDLSGFDDADARELMARNHAEFVARVRAAQAERRGPAFDDAADRDYLEARCDGRIVARVRDAMGLAVADVPVTIRVSDAGLLFCSCARRLPGRDVIACAHLRALCDVVLDMMVAAGELPAAPRSVAAARRRKRRAECYVVGIAPDAEIAALQMGVTILLAAAGAGDDSVDDDPF